MKKVSPPLNIEIPETVKREADRLAEDPDAILRKQRGETEASPNPLSIAGNFTHNDGDTRQR